MLQLIALQTILFREIYRFVRIWPQTILPAAITTSLYFLIFGTLIGSRVGPMQGISYMDYIMPGVVLMSVVTNAYGNVVASFYSTKFQRNIEELLVSPVSSWVILAGYVGGGVARGVAVGSVVGGIGMFFSPVPMLHPEIVAGMFLLTAALFSLAGFVNAVYANSFDDISIVPNFVLTPLVYLGGVFYSVDLLPGIWRTVSLGNPILYMVSVFRYGFLGVSDVDIETGFLIVTAAILALLLWALVLLRRGTGLKA
ncbi:ABC transporter permease [Methylomagnum ishizawai]|uniref:ABC transporter permease n=1 Tax=Methylomagnum ishizawai TaxID=1760988 RepID=UPI001C328E99|nr:ABC transporter permease [Methylomagnum ishizawai]BBL76137.1 transport permease protein [Methylomagnum ishizawai]